VGKNEGWLRRIELVLIVGAALFVLIAYVISKITAG
jgi:hypothetical protein